MGFKLGSEKRGFKNASNIKILRKNLGKNIKGEARNGEDGGDPYIAISKNVKPGSKEEKTVTNHEAKHIEDMQTKLPSGEPKLAYGDHWVRYNNKTYARKGGKIKHNNNWYVEGDPKLPWEAAAKKAENGSALAYNGKITTRKEEKEIMKNWSDSRKAKYEETKEGMKELGIDKIERKYRDLRYPYQDDKKIKILKRDIAELEEKAIHAGKVNKNRILNKIEKLKAKLPKRAQ